MEQPGPVWTKQLRKMKKKLKSHKNRNLKKTIFLLIKEISNIFYNDKPTFMSYFRLPKIQVFDVTKLISVLPRLLLTCLTQK